MVGAVGVGIGFGRQSGVNIQFEAAMSTKGPG
jgi:hypothetical protein